VNREAYLDTKNTKFEARNSKQYKNLNDPNSKLCFAWLYCQMMLFGVSSTKLRQQPIWCGTIRAVLR